ncbi:MAG: Hsp33 family molecular chaperone HslO [Clostridiales bacterium]|nr:Hsp33 family molecular chaperone HslO [Clostridiales bacterium]
MGDYIVRATAADNQIRAFASLTTNLVEDAKNHHNTSPIATAALGRLLTAGGMMGIMLKGDQDILTLQIKGDGPIGGLTVTADSKANVKGYVHNPSVMLPPSPMGKLDVGGAIGQGYINVIKDMGLKEPYSSQTNLISGEVAEDLTYYFATSEQVPSAVGLGVLMNKDNTVNVAGGFIIQLMPFAEEDIINKLEEKIASIKSVTDLLSDLKTPEKLLEHILGDFDLNILETSPTKFYCNCSKERIEKAIISIGKKEIKEMIDDNETIEVNCHFCSSSYNFTVDELKALYKSFK